MCSESEAGLWRRPSAVWELSVPSTQAGRAGGEDPRLSVESDFLKGVCLSPWVSPGAASAGWQPLTCSVCAFDMAGGPEEGRHPAPVLHEGLEPRSDSALLPVT